MFLRYCDNNISTKTVLKVSYELFSIADVMWKIVNLWIYVIEIAQLSDAKSEATGNSDRPIRQTAGAIVSGVIHLKMAPIIPVENHDKI